VPDNGFCNPITARNRLDLPEPKARRGSRNEHRRSRDSLAQGWLSTVEIVRSRTRSFSAPRNRGVVQAQYVGASFDQATTISVCSTRLAAARSITHCLRVERLAGRARDIAELLQIEPVVISLAEPRSIARQSFAQHLECVCQCLLSATISAALLDFLARTRRP